MLSLLFTLALSLRAAPPVDCAALATKFEGIVSAVLVPAAKNLPAHCEVRGVIAPEAKFALKLPTTWNERFQMAGNGGSAGVISIGAVDAAIRQGFAAVSTDTGHDAATEPMSSFAWLTPRNPNARRKFLDFAYLAVHETALLARHIAEAYYGKPPRYSYFVGCSTGGRQGLVEAQRYPEDFDGIIAGAPDLHRTANVMSLLWILSAQKGPGAIPPGKLPLLAQRVYDKCEALDGIIEDPRQCSIIPARDFANDFTPAQIAALTRIYDGVRDSKGNLLYPGYPPGSELAWKDNLIGPSDKVLLSSENHMKFALLSPPPGPEWTYTMFDYDKDPARLNRADLELGARHSDMTAFKRRGGKIIQYSGWADQQVNPLPGIAYYESVPGAASFYRLFMVPGMYHCHGGPGCGQADWLRALMQWVEKGIAPDAIEGAHVEDGKTTRTRPLCPYPQMARNKGTGFNCELPHR